MGWETRGGHRYFYQKKRENGKVVSKYLGNGLAAEICEGADSTGDLARVAETRRPGAGGY